MSAKIGVCGLKIALAFTLHPAFAQVTAAVSGTIEDASGGALGGVTVSVKSVETGISRVTTTGENGAFRVLSLPVGPLELSGEKQGFKRTVRTGINLVVGQEAVVNLRLHLGHLKQEVAISSEAPLVNTTTGEASGFVGERAVKNLPLNGRSWDNLIALNPGAVSYGLKSANTTTSNGNTFTVAGRRPMDNLVLLNGIEYTGASPLALLREASAEGCWALMPSASLISSPIPIRHSMGSAPEDR